MAEVDPEHSISGWCGALDPPSWVSLNAYKQCHHCKDGFRRGHQHHCRLCGHMFCSTCTGKYHIPMEFKKKSKPGAVRVCNGCRDNALERREEFTIAQGLEVRKHIPANFRVSAGRTVIHPPKWVDVAAYPSCFKCRTKFKSGHKHHCRTCGDMFCTECSTKMNVPEYLKIKHKKGKVRVCLNCRYHITAGAEFEARDPPETPHAVKRPSGVGLVTTTGPVQCSAPGCVHPRASNSLYCSSNGCRNRAAQLRVEETREERENSLPPPPPPDDSDYSEEDKSIPTQMVPQAQFMLPVVWAGSNTTIAQIGVNADTHLKTMNQLLLRAAPHLREEKFHYLCAGVAVDTAYWDIFPATKFHPAITLERDVDTMKKAQQDMLKASTTTTTTTTITRRVEASRINARALFDFKPTNDSHLGFQAGDVVSVIKSDNEQWWFGQLTGRKGWFPANFVEKIVPGTEQKAAKPQAIEPKGHFSVAERQSLITDGDAKPRKRSILVNPPKNAAPITSKAVDPAPVKTGHVRENSLRLRGVSDPKSAPLEYHGKDVEEVKEDEVPIIEESLLSASSVPLDLSNVNREQKTERRVQRQARGTGRVNTRRLLAKKKQNTTLKKNATSAFC